MPTIWTEHVLFANVIALAGSDAQIGGQQEFQIRNSVCLALLPWTSLDGFW